MITIAGKFRLVVFMSKVQLFYTVHRLQNRLEGEGERGEGCHPSDLLCWLTVIWSGAPTDSLGGRPTILYKSSWTYCTRLTWSCMSRQPKITEDKKLLKCKHMEIETV